MILPISLIRSRLDISNLLSTKKIPGAFAPGVFHLLSTPQGKSRLKGGLILRGRLNRSNKFNRLKKKTPKADAGPIVMPGSIVIPDLIRDPIQTNKVGDSCVRRNDTLCHSGLNCHSGLDPESHSTPYSRGFLLAQE